MLRKEVLECSLSPCTASVSGQYASEQSSTSFRSLTVGRLLIGTGIGVSAVVVPAYLGEVAPAALRGRIVEAYEVMLCLGMLSAMLVDAALQHAPHNWRWMVGAPVVPAIVLASKQCAPSGP